MLLEPLPWTRVARSKKADSLVSCDLFQKLCDPPYGVHNVRMYFAISSCFDSDDSSLSETLTLA